MKPIIVLENIRSAYNVGNIIRTADALGYDVVLSGFTPHPDDGKVAKTSLGSEEYVEIRQFWNTAEALQILREEGYVLIAAEGGEGSVSLDEGILDIQGGPSSSSTPQDAGIAIIVGNEKEGVLPETLSYVDHIVHIPMEGHKESLNVGQAAAIMMWAMR